MIRRLSQDQFEEQFEETLLQALRSFSLVEVASFNDISEHVAGWQLEFERLLHYNIPFITEQRELEGQYDRRAITEEILGEYSDLDSWNKRLRWSAKRLSTDRRGRVLSEPSKTELRIPDPAPIMDKFISSVRIAVDCNFEMTVGADHQTTPVTEEQREAEAAYAEEIEAKLLNPANQAAISEKIRAAFAAKRVKSEPLVVDARYVTRTHEELWPVCKKLPSDFEPYGMRSRDGCEKGEEWRDCSCGCAWYHVLIGEARHDWGICANRESPRAGLLTFEHQGCPKYESEPNSGDEIALVNGQPRHEQATR